MEIAYITYNVLLACFIHIKRPHLYANYVISSQLAVLSEKRADLQTINGAFSLSELPIL